MRASSHPLFARYSHAARALFVRCSRVVRALFVRARTHPRTTRRARLLAFRRWDSALSLVVSLGCSSVSGRLRKGEHTRGTRVSRLFFPRIAVAHSRVYDPGRCFLSHRRRCHLLLHKPAHNSFYRSFSSSSSSSFLSCSLSSFCCSSRHSSTRRRQVTGRVAGRFRKKAGCLQR